MAESEAGNGFICDHMLLKLARWLRMAGFDTMVPEDPDDDEMARLALDTGRTLLTRDKDLSNRKGINALRIVTDDMEGQLSELQGILSSIGTARTSRCPLCNEVLVYSDPGSASLDGTVPASVLETQEVFFRCPGCSKIYWKGTHWTRIERVLRSKGLDPILPRPPPQAKSMT